MMKVFYHRLKSDFFPTTFAKNLVKELINAAGNHPEYVQQLAHHTWSLTEDQADKMILNYAMEMVMNTNSIFYQEICDNISNIQINLIKAVFQGETQLTSTDMMQKYNLGTGNIDEDPLASLLPVFQTITGIDEAWRQGGWDLFLHILQHHFHNIVADSVEYIFDLISVTGIMAHHGIFEQEGLEIEVFCAHPGSEDTTHGAQPAEK